MRDFGFSLVEPKRSSDPARACIHLQRAFSLVELSIVLVILGLLTGGILSGQALIRAAELRSVTADFSRYHAALRTFQDKYFAIPGDMTNAIAFWGAADGASSASVSPSPASCWTASQTGAGTCNGNGDGVLVNGTSVVANPQGETFHAWKQLANAGLVEGTYTGFPRTSGTFEVEIGISVPRARISNAGFTLWTGSAGVADANWYPQKAATIIMFGVRAVISDGAAIKPEEAWNIDTKLDDGKPGLGNARTHKMGSPFTPNCTDGTDPNTSNYVLTSSAIACNLYMYIN